MSKNTYEKALEKALPQSTPQATNVKKLPRVHREEEPRVQLACNAFGLLVGHETVIYRYMVGIYGERNGKIVALNRKLKDDVAIVSQRDDCRAIFNTITGNAHSSAFFQLGRDQVPAQYLVYDLHDILYSTKQLNFRIAVLKNEKEICLKMPVDPENQLFGNRFSRVNLVIRDLDLAPIKASELCKTSNDLEKREDTSNRVFVETATSQYAMNHPMEHVMLETNDIYYFNPKMQGFTPQDAPEIDANRYLALGSKKTIHNVEGPSKKGIPVMFVECKRTPFYYQKSALEFASNILNMSKTEFGEYLKTRRLGNRELDVLNRCMKGLYVMSNFEKKSNGFHKVVAVTNLLANEFTFRSNDGEVTVAQYYQTKYDYRLKFPYAPLVECQTRGQANAQNPLFPLEIIHVCDNQRVQQQTPELTQKIIKACAVPPLQNFGQIVKARNAWNSEQCDITQTTGIRVTNTTMKFDGREIAPPKINMRKPNTIRMKTDPLGGLVVIDF